MGNARSRTVIVLAISIFVSGCIVLYRGVEVQEHRKDVSVVVQGPAKAHLLDGSVVVYRNGLNVLRDTLFGSGERYDLKLAHRGTVKSVPIDSVLGFESFVEKTKPAESVLLSAVGTAAATPLAALAMFAIFGSCPTFYTDSAGARRLEAEGFSYSIAPPFETRDVDPLRGAPQGNTYRLQVLNEALETHYINQLEILTVAHAPEQRLLADQLLEPILVGKLDEPRRAVGRDGDLLRRLRRVDGATYSAPDKRLAAAREDDLHDAIELTFAPRDADSAVVVLDLRNSLLSTVLLYDVMLAGAGPRAVDWIGKRLDEVGPAAELGKWYANTMGLRVQVWRGGAWHEAARVGDSGPIAWKEMAMAIPIERAEPIRVRLYFPLDAWRIDRVAIGTLHRPVRADTLRVARVKEKHTEQDADIRSVLRDVDERYLITEPGQRVDLEFDVPATSPELRRSFLLASHGYYIEWLRQDWLRRTDGQVFQPGSASLLNAMRRWHARKETFERQFYSTAIKVE